MTSPMTVTPAARVTGRSLPAGGFRLHRAVGHPDPGAVAAVLRGQLAAHLVKGFVPVADCRRVARNFWALPHTARYGEGEDGVEAHIVGASHIEKTTDAYLTEVARAAPAVLGLYAGARDPLGRFRAVAAGLDEVRRVRPAAHEGRTAAGSKAVCWNSTGEYLLLPHDDLAQLSDPIQAGFEIGRVRRVMAVNAYPQVPSGAGQIQLWNVEPDDRTRAALGLTFSGYPYPGEALREHESIIVPVETGDLCVINGNLVHAVRGPSAPGDRRLLLTCFTGLDPQGDLLYWT